MQWQEAETPKRRLGRGREVEPREAGLEVRYGGIVAMGLEDWLVQKHPHVDASETEMMARQSTIAVLLVTVVVLLTTGIAFPWVATRDRGTWPNDWPKELDPLRDQARTIEIATLIQQTIYEITFTRT